MTSSEQKVINKLKQAGSKGVTFSDFPHGFRLAARIFDLKGRVWINKTMEKIGDTRRARYFLISENIK